MSETLAFFRAIYSQGVPENQRLTLAYPIGKEKFTAAHLRTVEEAAELAVSWDLRGRTVYFGFGLRRAGLSSYQVGKKYEILSWPGLYLDVDIYEPLAHSSLELPRTLEEVEPLLAEPEPTLAVHTGYGLQPYYLFADGPITRDAPGGVERYQSLLRAFQARFRCEFRAKGWVLDDTTLLTQLLRPPGLHNRNIPDSPKKTHLLLDSGAGHKVDDLQKWAGRPPSPVSESCESGVRHTSDKSSGNTDGDFLSHLERLCRKHPDKDKRAQLVSIYDGREFAQSNWDKALQQIAGSMAFIAFKIKPDVVDADLVEIFRPSLLKHMETETRWTLEEDLEWVRDKLERALKDAAAKSAKAAEIDAKIKAAFKDRARARIRGVEGVEFSEEVKVSAQETSPSDDEDDEEDELRLDVGDDTEVAMRELQDLGLAVGDCLADQGSLYQYARGIGIWSELEPTLLHKRLIKYSGVKVQKSGTNSKGQPYQPTPFKLNDRNANGIVNRMLLNASRLNFFAEAKPGIVFRNGFATFEKEKGIIEVLPHSREHAALCAVSADYVRRSTTPRWDQFLLDLRLDSTIQSFLHEFLGACLFGDITKYKLCVVLTGIGDNGKSTLLNLITAMFPEATRTAIKPHLWKQKFTVAGFVGKFINLVDEMPGTAAEESESFKAVVSGGTIQGEKKNQDPFHFRPRAGHIFAANALPPTIDDSEGWWSRWAVIPFTRQFREDEKDVNILAKLLQELPAILSRCVNAYADLECRGRFLLSDGMRKAKETWQSDSNHALRFCKERLMVSPERWMKSRDVFTAFLRWAEDDENLSKAELSKISSSSFGIALRKAGYEGRRVHGVAEWRVKLRAFASVSSIAPQMN